MIDQYQKESIDKKLFALMALVMLPTHSVAEVVQKFIGTDALAILKAGKIISSVTSDFESRPSMSLFTISFIRNAL